MGIFRDIKRAVGPTGDPSEPAEGGPAWEPIHDVTIDRFAELSAALARRGLAPADAGPFVASQGVGAADWAEVVRGWHARMEEHPALRQRFRQGYAGSGPP